MQLDIGYFSIFNPIYSDFSEILQETIVFTPNLS